MGFGAELDDLFDPPKIVNYCQEQGEVSDREAYRTWNMGQGMLVVTTEPERVISIVKKYGIDAKEVGRITQEKGIRIANKGFYSKNEQILEF
jgi:phosphoribosylformylglycinamidine cyclo-ligase